MTGSEVSLITLQNEKKQSLLDLIRVIYAPTKIFSSINPSYRKRGIIFVFFIVQYFYNYFVSNQLIQNDEVQNIFKDSGVEIPSSVLQMIQIITTFFSTLFAFAILLITFFLILLSLKIFKVSLSKKEVFLVLLYAQVPVLIGKGLKLFYLNQTDVSSTSTTPTGMITNLGLLVNTFTNNTVVQHIFSSIDLLELWSYFLIGLGISILGNTSLKNGLTSSYAVWGFLYAINIIVVLV